MPDLSRSVHSVAVAFGVSSSASTNTGWACGLSPRSGSNRLLTREKSALLTEDSGSRVSALDPPVIAARSVPPRLGGPLARWTAVEMSAVLMPQELSRPAEPRASEPVTAVFMKSLRLRSMIRSRLPKRPSPVRALRCDPGRPGEAWFTL